MSSSEPAWCLALQALEESTDASVNDQADLLVEQKHKGNHKDII